MEEKFERCNQETAHIKGSPIYTSEQMPKKLTWNPIDEEWMNNLKDKFWCTQYHRNIRKELSMMPSQLKETANIMEKMLNLRDKILLFGGQEVCMPFMNPDAESIMERGQLWYGDKSVKKKGIPSHCHYNCAQLWKENEGKYKIATGYALSIDVMWREHSWCIEIRPKVNRVIETTVPRVAYYGMVLTDIEAEKFFNEIDE